jgi:hypothetical protein
MLATALFLSNAEAIRRIPMNIALKQRWLMIIISASIIATYMQALAADHIVIPVSNPLKPITVKVALNSGSISVSGYSGKEVIMDVQSWAEANRRPSRGSQFRNSENLKRISSPKTGLAVQEENNIISIGNGAVNQSISLALQVPNKTNLIIDVNSGGAINVNQVEGDVRINREPAQGKSKRPGNARNAHHANIEVHQVKGEVEINSDRGSVTLDRISGNVIAYASNGDLRASFLYVKPGKPMSFSSMNGVIDVWLPPDIKANVTMQSAGGEINSDFDIKIDSASVAVPGAGKSNSRTRIPNRPDRTVIGKINGGGPEIQFKTYKGDIYIRKFSEAPRHSPGK